MSRFNLDQEQVRVVIALGIVASMFTLQNTVENQLSEYREDAILSVDFMIISLAVPWGIYLALLGISSAGRVTNARHIERIWNWILNQMRKGARGAYDIGAIGLLFLPIFYSLLIVLEVNGLVLGKQVDATLGYIITQLSLPPNTSFALLVYVSLMVTLSLLYGVKRYPRG